MAKRGPRSLNRGLISHSFIQLFRDFGYWPLNWGWLLIGAWTVLLCCYGDLSTRTVVIQFIVVLLIQWWVYGFIKVTNYCFVYSNKQWQNSTSCHFSLKKVELVVKFLQNYHAKHLIMVIGLSLSPISACSQTSDTTGPH